MQKILVSILLFSFSTPAWAGGGGYFSQTFNLVLLLAFFAFLAWKNLPPLFRNRSQDIQYQIDKGQKELDAANKRNEDLKKQIANLGERIEAIQKQAEADVKAMEAKMSKQISDEKYRIKESAQRSIAEELSRAKSELQRESVEIAVELAAEVLKKEINEDDHQRLSQTFVQAVAKEGTHG